MLKKLILPVVALCGIALSFQPLHADQEIRIRIERYSKEKEKSQRIKNFIAGLGIGIAHGITNAAISDLCVVKGFEMPLWAYFLTWIAATKLENVYNGESNVYLNANTRSTHWGRGIGQFVTENLLFEDFCMNMSLFGAVVG